MGLLMFRYRNTNTYYRTMMDSPAEVGLNPPPNVVVEKGGNQAD
jgi:hypothetical protein